MKTPGRIGASLLATLLALASGCGSSGSTSATEVSESSRSVPSASAGSSPAASGASASVAIATTDSTSGTSPSGFTVASTFTDSDALVAALTAIGVACSGKLAPLESSEVPNAGYVCRDSDPSSFDAMVYQSAEDRNTTRDWVSNVEYLGTVQGDMWDVHCWVPTSCEPLEVTFGSDFIPSNGLRTSQPSPSTSVSATTTTTPSTSGTSASPATSDSDDQLCVIRSVEDMFAPCAPAPEPKGVKHSDPGTYQELPDDQPKYPETEGQYPVYMDYEGYPLANTIVMYGASNWPPSLGAPKAAACERNTNKNDPELEFVNYNCNIAFSSGTQSYWVTYDGGLEFWVQPRLHQ